MHTSFRHTFVVTLTALAVVCSAHSVLSDQFRRLELGHEVPGTTLPWPARPM